MAAKPITCSEGCTVVYEMEMFSCVKKSYKGLFELGFFWQITSSKLKNEL